MVLQIASFCVSQNKTKGEVDFQDGDLVGKDAAQLVAKAGWTDRRRAETVPILKSVVATKTGADLGPVLPVRVRDVFFRGRNTV